MDHTDSVPDSARHPSHSAGSGRRTAAGWVGLVLLTLVVLATGAFVGLLGPLLALGCDSCQDGIRGARYGAALIPIAHDVVPVATLATVAGIFLPRGGARVGFVGLGVLALLLVVMLILARYPA